MTEEAELGLLNSKFKTASLSQLHVVSAPKKNIVSLAEFEKSGYNDLINKLNEIVFKIFKKGAMEAGYTFATLHYTFLSKTGAERDVGLSILNKLLTTYFQTFNSPFVYSVFLHSYILRWFRLIVLLETKTHEFLDFRQKEDKEWGEKYLRIYKFIDHPFKVFPNINLDNPIIPFTSAEDQKIIEELVVSNKQNPLYIGKEFAKFYHLNLARILKGTENLKYSFELQSMVGPILVIELNKAEIAKIFEGIAEYYFSMNTEFKKLLYDFDKDLNFKKIHFIRKKWISDNKFSGIYFSALVKERLSKK